MGVFLHAVEERLLAACILLCFDGQGKACELSSQKELCLVAVPSTFVVHVRGLVMGW